MGSAEFAAFCKANLIRTSTGRTGVWGQRRRRELLRSLEERDVPPRIVSPRARARFAFADYIEVFCNRVRLHSTLGYRTPFEALTEFQAAATAA
jgi:transposase InsO family protein